MRLDRVLECTKSLRAVRPVVPRIGPTTAGPGRGPYPTPRPACGRSWRGFSAQLPQLRALLRAEYQQVSALIYLRCTCGRVPAKDVDGALWAALNNVRGAA